MIFDVNLYLTLFACLVANIIATISGFGVSTILTPTLLIFFPIKETIFLVCIVHLFHDLVKTFFFYRSIDVPLTISFGLAATSASVVSSLILVRWQAIDFSVLLGVFLLAYAAILFFKPTIRIKKTWFTISMTGIITGFIDGIFGIVGAVRTMFLVPFNLDKESFAGTSGMISALVNSARIIAYIMGGITLTHQELVLLPFLIGTSFIGTTIGRYLIDSIPANIFQRVILIFIILFGIKLIIAPMIG
jgi:uncharacterized protein